MNGSIRRRDRRQPWQARYTGPDGKARSRSFNTRKEAAAWLRDEIGKMDRQTWIDPAGGTQLYADYATEWLLARVDIKPKTLYGYEELLRSRVLPEFGRYELRRISPQAVRAWVASMHADGLSPSRIRQAHQVLRASLGQALSDGLIGRNPAAGVDLPRSHEREMLYLTPAQIHNLAHLCDEYQAGAGTLVQFLAWGGLRWGEAVALRRSSLNHLNSSIVIRESATEVGGRLEWGSTKSHTSRTVVLLRPVFDLVDGHSAAMAPDDLIFTAPRGGPMRSGNYRRTVWRPAVTELASRHSHLAHLRIHDLRHTAASLAISAGGSIMAIQRMLGHKDASMTLDRYGHLYDDDLIDLASKLEAKFLAA